MGINLHILKHFFSKCNIFKSNFVKRLIETLVIGLIVGLIVSYLSNIPVISITGSKVNVNEDGKIKIGIEYKNNGKSPATNLYTKYLYGIDGQDSKSFIKMRQYTTDVVGPGDVFSYETKELAVDNVSSIFLIAVEFNDTSKVRECINKIFGSRYKFYKFCQYKNEKKFLLDIKKSQKDKYEEDLLTIINSMERATD